MNRFIWIFILALGCGGGEGEGGTAWWNVPTSEVWTDGNAGPAEDGEEEDGFEEPEQLFWGELQVGSEGPTGGEVGLFVIDEGGLRCDWFSEISGVGAASVGCADCTWSGTLQLAGFEKEVDDASCSTFGIDENTVDVGYAGEQAYWRPDSEWVAAGYSEIEGSAWFFEIVLQAE